jgi:hypothetical protein
MRSDNLAAVLGHCETFLEPLEKMNGKIGPTGATFTSPSSKSSGE